MYQLPLSLVLIATHLQLYKLKAFKGASVKSFPPLLPVEFNFKPCNYYSNHLKKKVHSLDKSLHFGGRTMFKYRVGAAGIYLRKSCEFTVVVNAANNLLSELLTGLLCRCQEDVQRHTVSCQSNIIWLLHWKFTGGGKGVEASVLVSGWHSVMAVRMESAFHYLLNVATIISIFFYVSDFN